jgi:hypothetical protein
MRARNTGNGRPATWPGQRQRGFPHAVPGGREGGGMVLRCGGLLRRGRGRAAAHNRREADHVKSRRS